jgi:hypothetical protein
MTDAQKFKSRRNLLMVIAVFVLPIVLAKLALTQNWLEYGVTNKGSLVGNELTLKDLGIADDELDSMWLMLYALPNDCTEQCEQTLLSVNNTLVALGKDRPKVRNVALYQHVLTEQQLSHLDASKWTIIRSPNEKHSLIQRPTVLLIDPLGNIILEHKPPELYEEQAMFGKGILADMKKLLKYSKIG